MTYSALRKPVIEGNKLLEIAPKRNGGERSIAS
jgi:hypothetical protein